MRDPLPEEFNRSKLGRSFTPQEVSRLLPDVKRRLNEVIKMKRYADSLKAEVERYNLIGVKTTKTEDKSRELDLQVDRLMKRIGELESAGIVVRDIDVGLVDFPAERFGERVYLCWKQGEQDVGYWHRADEGFSGRKPLKLQAISP